MKKLVALLLSAAVFLTGCAKQNGGQAEYTDDGRPDFYEYIPLHEDAVLNTFSADSAGTVYCVSSSMADNGEVLGYYIDITDLDGNTESYTSEHTFGGSIAAENGLIFFQQGENLCSYDPKTGELTPICPLTEFSEIKKIEVSGGSAFVLGISADRASEEGDYIDPRGQYYYSGEQVAAVNLSTGEKTVSPVLYPVALSAFNGECRIYAADKDGFYFCDFDGNNRTSHDIVNMAVFDLYDSEHYIFSAGFGLYCYELCAGTLRYDDGVSLIYEDYAPPSACTAAGYTFYQHCASSAETAREACVVRLKNSAYIKKNSKISFVSTALDVHAPFGCGYTIDYTNLSEQEFALTVLSQDSGYDICHASTFAEYAANIRDKGSFYPLDDIPEVREYLSRCLSCLREAAADENGSIWMIPVSIELPMLVLNKTSCTAAGADIRAGMTVREYTEICERLTSEGRADGIGTHAYLFTKRLLAQYLSANDSFDTPLFREFAEYAQEKINISSYPYPDYFPPVNNAQNEFGFGNTDSALERFLFSYDSAAGSIEWLAGMGLSFCEAPKIDPSGKNTASCEFLIVNPNSQNLAAALEYIAALCEYLTENGGIMLSDSELYESAEGLREICANAEISFSVSDELVIEPYKQYLSGSITLDEFITEADRKLAAYLNE